MTVNEDDRKIISEFQFYQQQMQAIGMQKEQFKIQGLELQMALDEMKDSQEKDAFKIAGPILIKKSITDLTKEIKEKKDAFDEKVTSLEKTEKTLEGKMKEIEPKIQKILASSQQPKE